MFRQSPSRTQRSRGIRVKHVLQICFLLAICFWLLFQVKHSHDKKKEFDEDDVKISQRTQSSNEVVKLGRKDLNPGVEDTTTATTRSQAEEGEEENAGEEKEIELEEVNADGNKFEEKGDELRGVGDDDVDERQEDKLDAEVNWEEDVIEEEKEKEEREKENQEKHSEDSDGQLDESSVVEHEDDEQVHEAREEHYKADDASSEVTHETEAVAAENENGNLEKSNELTGTNIVRNEQAVDNNTNDNNVGEQTTGYKLEDRKVTGNGGPSETRDNRDIQNVGSNSDDSSHDHLKLLKNTTEASTVTHSLSTNGMNKESDFSQSENVTTDGTASGVGFGLNAIIALGLGSNSSLSSTENQADSNLTSSSKVLDSDLNSGGTSNNHNSSLSIRPEESVKASKEGEDSSESSTTDTNNIEEATKSEDSSNDGTDGTSDGALETENPEEFQHDLIDASDSSMGLEEKDVRIDLETLPEIQTEGSNDEDAAAE